MYCGRDFSPSDPLESEIYTIDFIDDLTAAETILSATVALTLKSGTDASPSSHVNGSPFIVGTEVRQRLLNLVSGNVYTMQIVVTTSDLNVISLYSHVSCDPIL